MSNDKTMYEFRVRVNGSEPLYGHTILDEEPDEDTFIEIAEQEFDAKGLVDLIDFWKPGDTSDS